MLDVKTILEIDGEIIDFRQYYDIQIYSSINNALPILTFKLSDETGKMWSNLNFSVGSNVRVYYSSDGSDTSDVQVLPSTKFIIQKLYNGFEYNNNQSMSGYIQVTCAQAWQFYGDYTPHAYNCKKLGNLIKDICDDILPQAEIHVEDENFTQSTDSGSIRYKTGDSDLEFITRKLLPFTIVDHSNALFFVNKSGYVHLSGFNTLFSAQENLLICPDIDDQVGSLEALSQVLESKNIKRYLRYLTIEADIAPSEGVFEQLKNKLYLYDSANEKTNIGTQMPAINVGSDSDTVKKTYTPIKNVLMDDIDYTSSFYVGNRLLEEQIAAARNGLVSTNDLFRIVITVPNFVSDVSIGDTVFLWIPPEKRIDDDKSNDDGTPHLTDKVKSHWLNGKWLIQSEAVVSLKSNQIAVRYTLIRPAFYLDVNTSDLSDYKTFYKVK